MYALATDLQTLLMSFRMLKEFLFLKKVFLEMEKDRMLGKKNLSFVFLGSILIVIFSCTYALESISFQEQFPVRTKLRILTINVWSGLNYMGVLRMGKYETEEHREARFNLLVKQIKKIRPDIIFIQEANPVGKYSRKLARKLSFDEIHQVCLGGIKLGSIGIPSNLFEGNAILARPELNLKKHDIWKLSGFFGIFGSSITIHFNESILAVVGKIKISSTPIYLVNVHLTSGTSKYRVLLKKLTECLMDKQIPRERSEKYLKLLNRSHSRYKRRKKEIIKLTKAISKLPEENPVILAGDFNTESGSSELEILTSGKQGGLTFFDTFVYGNSKSLYTLDPKTNSNIKLAQEQNKYYNPELDEFECLRDLVGNIRKRVDYIFLSRHFSQESVCDSKVVLDLTENGIQVSDHYGIYSEIDLKNMLKTLPKEKTTVESLKKSRFEFFPMLMWDTDIGFGYGIKMFYLNPLKLNESFDAILFNSSKGERWYRFVFSWPDFEHRQGKIYPISLDLKLDYDRWMKSNFFGIGNKSEFKDREYYTKEPFRISMTLSRGFSRKLIGQVGFRYKTVKNSNFEREGSMFYSLPEINRSRIHYSSLFSTLRYDTRDNFINPSRGLVLQGEAEFTLNSKSSDVKFSRFSALFSKYYILYYPKTVIAFRFKIQSLFGDDLPVQVLLPVGGNRTIRGYPQSRFLGNVSAVFNAEMRFPIFWKVGGIVGFDAGKVWDSLEEFDLRQWAVNSLIGLRFYMKNFLIRFDMGFGKETTGIYFNFGHVF